MTRKSLPLALLGWLVFLWSGCRQQVSLDAGPPPRPVFFEFEGLKWGMTPEEVLAAWGPGEEGKAYRYQNKAGYSDVSLGFMSMPRSDVVHTDVKPVEGEQVAQFLIWISLSPGETRAKDKFRPELVTRFGEPLSGPALARRVDCESPRCEIWRAAECTLVQSQWDAAYAELNWPERLGSLVYGVAPYGLVSQLPRTDWVNLRGSVPPSLSAEVKARIDGFARGVDGTPVEEIVKAIGPPHLFAEEAPGKGQLHYLWLDGSLLSLRIENSKLHGVTGAFQTE